MTVLCMPVSMTMEKKRRRKSVIATFQMGFFVQFVQHLSRFHSVAHDLCVCVIAELLCVCACEIVNIL